MSMTCSFGLSKVSIVFDFRLISLKDDGKIRTTMSERWGVIYLYKFSSAINVRNHTGKLYEAVQTSTEGYYLLLYSIPVMDKIPWESVGSESTVEKSNYRVVE